jgi:hypothetical protein
MCVRDRDKQVGSNPRKLYAVARAGRDRRNAMRKTSLTTMTRAYFLLGALLVIAFFASVGPYLAEQTVNVWMAFGSGLAFIAYGRSNVRRPWISIAAIVLGTVWTCALVFTIFGVAEL